MARADAPDNSASMPLHRSLMQRQASARSGSLLTSV